MKKTKDLRAIAALIVITLGVWGCSKGDNYAKLSAEAAVKSMLKDPDSAKFSNEYVVREAINANGSQMLATCGWVNAKNSFGGYSGATRFVSGQSQNEKMNTFDTFMTTIEDEKLKRALPDHDETLFESIYWNQSCVDSTHPPSKTAAK